MEQIKQIKKKYEKELFAKKNVVAVAIGFKYTGGKKTKELAVAVDVSQKVAKNDLAKRDIIPEKLDGVRTDVVETGLIRALYDPTRKYRPAPGGVSIGHKNITAGTLGISVLPFVPPPPDPPEPPESDESYCSIFGLVLLWPLYQEFKEVEAVGKGDIYILSNNHILANCNEAQLGDPIYQPGPYDGGGPDDIIAQLSKFIPINFTGGANKVDCALALPLDQTNVVGREILEIGKVSGGVEAQLGMKVRKYGRTTQLNEGKIIQIAASVNVSYVGGKIAYFVDQIITEVMATGGDSGSLLVERDGQRAVGLLFAGSSTITIHNRIANVEKALDIEL